MKEMNRQEKIECQICMELKNVLYTDMPYKTIIYKYYIPHRETIRHEHNKHCERMKIERILFAIFL